MAGGQPGNQNAAKGATWNDAIRRALARAAAQKAEDPRQARATLDDIADRLIKAAADGDEWAIKELGNRLDGKSIQGVIDYTPPPVNPPVLNISFSRGGPGAQPEPDSPAEGNTLPEGG